MAKREFLNTKLVAQITTEVLIRIMSEQNRSIRDIANHLPQAYSFIWTRLNWTKWNYDFYESVAIALYKDKEWYRQLNIDICEYVLNHDKETFIEKFGTKRFATSEIKDFM